jgi:thiamine pyrophosphate-dependent acetolactate synthase large subunit-like protein
MNKKQRYPYTLSSVLLDSLINTGTPYLFGVAGSAERDLYDNLARDEYKERITFIQGNSEYPAARMSLGYAQASELVSPLIMHVQMGPANAALAVLDAKISKIPMFIFTVGHISTANDYREALYGYYRTQNFSANIVNTFIELGMELTRIESSGELCDWPVHPLQGQSF